MSYVCDIKHSKMNKSEKFESELRELAEFAKAISHPARLAILKYLVQTQSCISGDITEYIPLSRSTVSQHLKALRDAGLIHGEIDGLKINYCINGHVITKYKALFNTFFLDMDSINLSCNEC